MVESKVSHEALRKVFDSFDKDKSGFIDVSEIKLVSKELGHEVSDTDVERIFSEIDTNKDGKITFDEFSVWWYLGKPTKLEGLVYYQLKAQKLLDKVNAKITKLGQSLENKYEGKVESHYARVEVGEGEYKTKIHARAAFGGPEEKVLFEETLGKLGRDWEEEAIVFTFKSSNPESAKAGLKDVIDTVLKSRALEEGFKYDFEQIAEVLKLLSFDYFTTADTVGVVISSEDPFTQALVLSLITPVLLIVKKEGAGYVNIHAGLKNDFASALKNAQEGIKNNILGEIIEGFFAEINAKISPVLLDFARKSYYEELPDDDDGADPTIFPLLIRGSKIFLKFTEIKGETLFSLIEGLGLGIPISEIPSFGDLLKPRDGEDEDDRTILDELKEDFPPAIKAIDFFKEHAKASISLTLRVKKTVVDVKFHTSGIKEVFELFAKKY